MKRPSSLLFVTRSLVGVGGMQTHTRALVQFLQHARVSHTVLSFTGPRCLLPFFWIRVFVAGIFFSGDTMHFGDASFALVAYGIRLCRPRLRLTLTAHGLDVVFPLSLYQYILRRTLSSFDTIVAVSAATEATLLSRGVHADHTIIIPPCIILPTTLQQSADTGCRILLLGRQIPRKGTTWFLTQVLPRLLLLYPTLTVTIAGDGRELPAIRRIVAAQQQGNVVHILGRITDEKREVLFQESSHFLMPNVSVQGDMEGFGLVCTEAASRGLQVIAAAHEGIREAVLDGETGFLFTPENADDCLRTIQQSCRAPLARERIFRSAQEHFSQTVIGTQYLTHVFYAS